MNDVRINGVRYVPETNKPNNHHVKRLSTVLARECPYLSRTVRDNIVKRFEFDEVIEKQKEKPKSNSSPSNLYNIDNFGKIDDEGHVSYKNGKAIGRKSTWTIQQASEVRQWVNHGKLSKGNKAKQIGEKVGLPEHMVRKLIRNFKNDAFSKWLDNALSENAIKEPKKEKPKREDVGWFE